MKPAFYKPKNVGHRPWGSEDIAALVPGVATLKILRVEAGRKGRLQRHQRKDEAGYLLSGRMIVRWDDDGLHEKVLTSGDSYHFPPGCIHQEEAVSDCVVLEVSTPHANDRVGAEHAFGLTVPDDALPSTSEDEISMVEKWW